MRTWVCLLAAILSFLLISKVRAMECDAAFGPYACKDGTTQYVMDDEWTSKDCKDCKCHGMYSICCTLQPKYFDWFDPPKGCRYIWDEATCRSKVVDEFDDNKPCPEDY